MAENLVLQPRHLLSGVDPIIPVSWLDNETILTQQEPEKFIKINVNSGQKEVLTDQNWRPLGFGFDTDFFSKSKPNAADTIRYNNEIIGKYKFRTTPIATNGYISVITKHNDSGRISIAVWSAKRKTWTEIETNAIRSHIGWVHID